MGTDDGDLVEASHPEPTRGQPSEGPLSPSDGGPRDLVTYYRRRAAEYDEVYNKPERQVDIALLGSRLAHLLSGRRVLEVAAGTGYWTAFYAQVVELVTATDINSSVLDIARDRRAWPGTVTFHYADAFDLDSVPGTFDAAFVGFLWSHISLSTLDAFLLGLSQRLEPSALVVLADNRYVEGSNHPITRRDAGGNTYQHRRLADGSSWEVLKNFPAFNELAARLSRFGSEVAVEELTYYWLASFRTPSTGT
jgi:SAM-dependent methyltransferase